MAANPSSSETWPDYLPGPRDDILALGVISLNYGHLEGVLRVIFTSVTGMTEEQVATIFPKITNDLRQKILEQILALRDFPKSLKELVEYFIKGFTICASNRHAIMHSFHAGIHNRARRGGLVLGKYSKSGEYYVCFATKEILRSVADDIDEQSNYGMDVLLALTSWDICCRDERRDDFSKHALPNRPQLPDDLNLHFQPDSPIGPPPP